MKDVIGSILPLAIAVTISPIPIIAEILLLFTKKPVANAASYLAGFILGVAGVLAILVAIAGTINLSAGSGPSTGAAILRLALGALLLAAALRQFRGRPEPGQEAAMPKWMNGIAGFAPGKSLLVGVGIGALNPKNIIVGVAAAVAVASASLSTGQEVGASAVYVLVAVVGVAAPLVVMLAMGKKAQPILDSWKAWLGQNQTRKVIDVMAEVLRGRGCDVTLAAIGFTDPSLRGQVRGVPHAAPVPGACGDDPGGVTPPRPAKIEILDVVTEREYDLVCIGSPTWWLSTDVPVRSFLESDTAGQVLKGKPFAAPVCCRRYWKHNLKTVRRLGTKHGGVFADGIHFAYQGGQVRSLLSLLSYLGSGKYRDRYLGIKIPPTNLQDYHLEAARKFADQLADRLAVTGAPQ